MVGVRKAAASGLFKIGLCEMTKLGESMLSGSDTDIQMSSSDYWDSVI